MNKVQAILKQAGVQSALIVDDVYDPIPRASDLLFDGDEWTHFFEDLSVTDREQLCTLFPVFNDVRADELRADDAFVAALWTGRAKFKQSLVDPLFARYDNDTVTDQRLLEPLVKHLVDLGLKCDTSGREFKEKAASADLVVIDLFLGSSQDDSAIATTIQGLADVLRRRTKRPPLVVLMSRSTRLEEQRAHFRDSCGVFESMFRVVRKDELAQIGRLNRVLSRLAGHYVDALRLAGFVSAWETGLSEASKRVVTLLRTLDLVDYAQLREMLLVDEGEPTGSYLVDVFDHVLQHEVERERPIIDAAISLSATTGETYPPPYVAGSRELQSLVFRSLFQNGERLRLTAASGNKIAFGDVIARKTLFATDRNLSAGAMEDSTDCTAPTIAKAPPSEVLLALSPACDLQRRGVERVIFLVGTLESLAARDWTYGEDPVRTPVIELANHRRFWIRWNLRHIQTLSYAEIDSALESPDGLVVVGRLREAHALAIQQKLLSRLGRVGQTAQMVGTFAVTVEAYLPDKDGKLARLPIKALETCGGVCYVGRLGEREMRLALCEDACDSICDAIAGHDLSTVHQLAQDAVSYLRVSDDLRLALEKGITLPSPAQQGFRDIVVANGVLVRGGKKPDGSRVIGLISRNQPIEGVTLESKDLRRSGIIFGVQDPTEIAL